MQELSQRLNIIQPMQEFYSVSRQPKPLWKESITLRVIFGTRGLTVKVPPLAILLAAGLMCTAAHQVVQLDKTKEVVYQNKIAELEKDKKRVQTLLQRKEHEKKQALALAESRSEELWDEIHDRDQQMDKLWEAVGQHPERAGKKSVQQSRGPRRFNTYRLKRRYDQIAKELKDKGGEMKSLQTATNTFRQEKARRAEERALSLSTLPSIYPCQASITSPFGYRMHPVLGYAKFHSGIDLGAGYGQPVLATAAGRVTCADWLGGYGMAVTIDHGSGLSTLYGHNSQLHVSTGQYVKKGQIIASVGSTGMSTGPHCHYEVHKDGTQVDPMPYMH